VTGFRPGSPAELLLLRTGLRLGLQAAAIVSVIVVLLTGTAVLVVLQSQHTEANDLLAQALARADDVQDPPSGVWLSELDPDGAIHETDGSPAPPAVDEALRRTGTSCVGEAFDLHMTQREYRVQTEHRSDGSTFSAVLDLHANHAERDRLITAMLGAGGISLLLAAAAGAWLGRRATEPLSTALTLQRRFVRDASHELRTPLTLLSTRAQLLRRRLRASSASPETLSTTDRVVADTQRLATILDDLLLAADPAAARTRELVDLARLAAEVVTEASPHGNERSILITGPDPDTTLADTTPTPTDTTVQGSPTALRRPSPRWSTTRCATPTSPSLSRCTGHAGTSSSRSPTTAPASTRSWRRGSSTVSYQPDAPIPEVGGTTGWGWRWSATSSPATAAPSSWPGPTRPAPPSVSHCLRLPAREPGRNARWRPE
jgi:signal transduction histidine kinase